MNSSRSPVSRKSHHSVPDLNSNGHASALNRNDGVRPRNEAAAVLPSADKVDHRPNTAKMKPAAMQLGDEQSSVPTSSNTLASSSGSTPTMILSKASLTVSSDGVLDPAASPTSMPSTFGVGNRVARKSNPHLHESGTRINPGLRWIPSVVPLRQRQPKPRG
ncbi:hypothetical protein BCR44DRAFT_1194937 [Catenaria anguillulae PL171]|uniref:Uncharacterized protein n=1 Tax=Catenaria anguillulae PL171 TaxID=765915 RepID=A0A1Y2HGD2_9FUNG|nr:hypothetical protein BCR44DRAFT_1194937 [Catenaria anguillulae PL171]